VSKIISDRIAPLCLLIAGIIWGEEKKGYPRQNMIWQVKSFSLPLHIWRLLILNILFLMFSPKPSKNPEKAQKEYATLKILVT